MESKFVSFEPRGDKTEFTIYSIDQSLDVGWSSDKINRIISYLF